MAEPERIILERAEDGERWGVRAEGADVEGHLFAKRGFSQEEGDTEGHGQPSKLSLEPAGEDEQGEPLFRLEGEDAEGHRFSAWSDVRLKRDFRAL